MKILSFGEILWDVYPDSKYIGGAPLNFAAHLSKQGFEVYMLSALGNDELGRDALNQLKKWNISSDLVAVSSTHKTGMCQVTLNENSVPSYKLLDDVAYDYIPCDMVQDYFDVLYFGTLALRSKNNYNSLKQLVSRNTFKEIFVDVNIREPFYSKETVSFAVENATIIKISLEEMQIVSELIFGHKTVSYVEFSEKLSKKHSNLKCIIITLGEKGAYALDCVTSLEYFCDSEKVEVKSTVGAGDSFSAAFLNKYLIGQNLDKCLKYASVIAGFVVSHYDAVPDYSIKDILNA